MAEVVWQARRVSDGVLVDVTGDTAGTPAGAPTPNALEGGGGGVIAVIGPFAVPFDDPGVNNTDTILTTLDEGTVVLRVWCVLTEALLCDDNIEVTVDITTAANVILAEVYRVSNFPPGGPITPIDLAAADQGPAGGGHDTVLGGRFEIAYTPEAGCQLRSYIFVNGASQITSGEFSFYAMTTQLAV